jgi:hypothetical protein
MMRWTIPVLVLLGGLLVGCRDTTTEPVTVHEEAESTSEDLGDAGHPPMLSHGMSFHGEQTEKKDEIIDDKGGELDLEKYKLTAPAGWGRKEASNMFVTAEYVLPRAEGDEADGRLTVSSAGGSVKDNIDRWRTQFGDKPSKESQETINVEGVEVTVVDFSGEFNDQRGPFAPAVTRPNYRMVAAIIPIGEELHFIKAYGPQKTMETHTPKILDFIKSVRKK